MRRTIAAVVLGLVSVALTACANQAQTAEPQMTPSPASAGAAGKAEPPMTASPLPEGLVDADTGATISPDPAVWDDQSRAAAVAAAEAALTAYARPGLDHDTWWAGLEPHLTQKAAQDYVDVDPARIPVSKLTGPGTIIQDSSAYVAMVKIPTNAGRYDVLVIRSGGSAPWLASRFMKVEEAG